MSATASGDGVLAFYLDRHELTTHRPEQDQLLAMAYVAPDGEVRWAKQVPLV